MLKGRVDVGLMQPSGEKLLTSKEAKVGFKLKKESYSGGIKAISIGKGDAAITVGGETCYPFYTFEGSMPNKPVIAMEIWDMEPEDWAAPAMAHFKDVASDPAAWAKKCVDKFGADAIVVQLKSIDPNDKDASPRIRRGHGQESVRGSQGSRHCLGMCQSCKR